MAGFFSLGGRERGSNNQDGNNNNNEISPESWFLYNRNNSNTNNTADRVDLHNNNTCYKLGFELWQPQDYGQHHHQQQLKDFYPAVAAIGGDRSHRSSGVNNIIVSDETRSGGFLMMRSGASSSGEGLLSCQDCGNQAKKDCSHMRCRTCCKSRGFHCQTHVKSTWVPVAKRRERLQQLAALQDEHVFHYNTTSQLLPRRDDNNVMMPKRLKDNRPVANHPNASSGLDMSVFPAELTSQAVFRCVRVSSIDNAAENQYAYQTSVNIGGHLFRGVLYDQGPESSHQTDRGSSTGNVNMQQQLNVITNTASSSAAAANSRATAGAAVSSSQVNAFLDASLYQSGSLYFPPTS